MVMSRVPKITKCRMRERCVCSGLLKAGGEKKFDIAIPTLS
jgi:hypothetical protein